MNERPNKGCLNTIAEGFARDEASSLGRKRYIKTFVPVDMTEVGDKVTCTSAITFTDKDLEGVLDSLQVQSSIT